LRATVPHTVTLLCACHCASPLCPTVSHCALCVPLCVVTVPHSVTTCSVRATVLGHCAPQCHTSLSAWPLCPVRATVPHSVPFHSLHDHCALFVPLCPTVSHFTLCVATVHCTWPLCPVRATVPHSVPFHSLHGHCVLFVPLCTKVSHCALSVPLPHTAAGLTL
jgi:hypothetical protein